MTFDELVHYLKLGGVTLWVILLFSLFALGVAIERWITLWRFSERTRTLGESIARNLLRGDVTAARSAAERSNILSAELFRVGFARHEQAKDRPALVHAAVERERAQLGLRLKQNLWVLGTIGATAPFIGLLGTVVGIMRAFRDLGIDVEAGGSGGSAAVMSGISEALIVTAVGILVAVEAVLLYNYFQARVSRLVIEIRLLADEFVELLRGPEQSSGPGILSATPVNGPVAGSESPPSGER